MNRNTTIALLVLLLIAAIYGVVTYLTPLQLDDLNFVTFYRDANHGMDTFSWDAWRAYMEYMCATDNARLSNAILPITQLCGPLPALFPWVNGAMVAIFIALVVRLATGSFQRPLWLVCVWAVVLVALPWRNYIFVRDYSINYIWASVIDLLFILLMFRLMQSRKMNAGEWIAVVLTTLLAAGWHESFALCTFLGVAAVLVFGKKDIAQKNWRAATAVMFIFLIVTLAYFIQPGMESRMKMHILSPMISPLKTGVDNWMTIILLCIYIYVLTRKGRWRLLTLLSDHVVLCFTFIALGGVVISLMVPPTARTTFWPQLAASVAVTRLIWLTGCLHFHSRRRAAVFGSVLTAILVAQSATVIYWANLLRLDIEYANAVWSSGADTAFRDVVDTQDVPLYTLRLPASMSFAERHGFFCSAKYYHRDAVSVVPQSLNTHVLGNARHINGKFYEVGNQVVIDSLGLDDYALTLNLKLSTSDTPVQALTTPLIFTDATGRRLTWFKFYRTIMKPHAP